MPATIEEIPSYFDRAEVMRLGEQELNFFAPLALPDICRLAYPPMFQVIWNMLRKAVIKDTGFDRLALGLPRGFTKTTFLKLFILHTLLYTDRSFILIIGATAQRAEDILSDIADMLDDSNIKTVFGDWRALTLERDTQSVKKFVFRGRKLVIAAMGTGGSVRGLNIKNMRPDIIVMDDMQSWDEAESPTQADHILTWMTGTLMKAASKQRCLYIFVGNLYPFPGSILRKLKQNPEWTSFVVGGLLADGESIWPELQSREQLLAEFEHDIAIGKPEIFLAEVLNDDEASSRSGIDVSRIPFAPHDITDIPAQGAFIVIDPAGDKKHSDSTEIAVFYLYDGIPLCRAVSSGQLNPEQTIREALRLALTHGATVIAVESVAYQASLLYWFQVIAQQVELTGIEFVEVHPRGWAKNARIKDMLGLLVTGKLLLHMDIRSRVIHQIVHWNPLRRDNVDDLLDVLAYCYQVIDNYGHMIAINSPNSVEGQELNDCEVVSLEENSLF